MTTNVYDKRAGQLASDSRWSRISGEWIIWVDDTGYDKIICDARLGFLFAGELDKIDIWKQWVIAGRKGVKPLDQLRGGGMSVIQIDLADGEIKFQSHKFLSSTFGVAIKALYAGNGAIFAKTCWDVNKCALKAVDSAKIEDKSSGGTVMHYDRKSKSTNIVNTASVTDVQQQLKDKGIIMHTKDACEPMSVIDAANDPSNPIQQALAQMVVSGGIALSAPFPEMNEPWSDEKIREFEAALNEYD